jgi:hypothetical protein
MPRHRLSSRGLQTFADKLQRVKNEPEMREILCHLPEAMAAAVADAPVRRRPYRLGRADPGPRRKGESAWLRALWNQYGPRQPTAFHLLWCDQLLGVEVALGDQESGASERVDLIGVSAMERVPVIIEFASQKEETVTGALLKAAELGLAVKKAWPHRLRADWLDALRTNGLGEPHVPVFLETLRVIVSAPAAFWSVTGTAAIGNRRAKGPSVWRAVNELQSALRRQNFWPCFVRVDVDESRHARPLKVSAHNHAVPAA